MTQFKLFPEEFPDPREPIVPENLFAGEDQRVYEATRADIEAEEKSRAAFVRMFPGLATADELGIEIRSSTWII